ncbi:Zn-dependent peptidase ImmA, M78 family [Paucidesulfovibrio gracilis DSM 16080]|uniref:Zn-dependent peptidase ImmA, M78 family n=1 Tax=Paucidesulfovibrio gracilis DSM 16080 TaxID=1121449 RepID=A0A1T4X819_9BACT|nr:ImmA/IrrE family metallo-endopeptidase [Paucidesulfovibrio gracilis]SKA85742.1 Zn-dependent peptidase ImmA, M78 family [Paucidesulfovibrio gracilis DSM 16080]
MPNEVQFAGTKAEVCQRAKAIRSQYFKDKMSVNDFLSSIMDENNGNVQYSDTVERGETLKVNADGSFVIYLSNATSQLRDNFTIAHELGHYFLHTDIKAPGDCIHTRRGSNRKEWEANWFAAELLMPAEEFTAAAKEHNNNAYRLATLFEVSPSAAMVRLTALNLD